MNANSFTASSTMPTTSITVEGMLSRDMPTILREMREDPPSSGGTRRVLGESGRPASGVVGGGRAAGGRRLGGRGLLRSRGLLGGRLLRSRGLRGGGLLGGRLLGGRGLLG